MSLKLSTGLRNHMLSTGSVKAGLETGGGFISIYSGIEPTSADDDVSGFTEIIKFSVNSDGLTPLTFEAAAAAGSLVKTAAEVWSGVVAVTGTVSFYRHYINGDGLGLSTTAIRLQGTVGVGGADLNMTTILLTQSDTEIMDYYSVNLPSI